MAGRKKGSKKTGGRTKAVENKVTADVKASILYAYKTIGGDEAFADWATEERTEFYKMFVKLLPKEVDAKMDMTVKGKVTVEFV